MTAAVKTTEETFIKALEHIINKHSQEDGSDTPDFIIASFLGAVLEAWNLAQAEREAWYSRPRPGQPGPSFAPDGKGLAGSRALKAGPEQYQTIAEPNVEALRFNGSAMSAQRIHNWVKNFARYVDDVTHLPDDRGLEISTFGPKAGFLVQSGDWVVRSVTDEIFVVRDDIFKMTFKRV